MTSTNEARDLIDTSIHENRTVTAYPDTQAEFDELYGELVVLSDGDTDSADVSGDGYSGPESHGYLDVWSEDGWRVNIVYPAS